VPLASATNDPTQPAKGGTAYVTGDWNVTTAKTYKDCIIVVKGNLTVKSGGSLDLDNVTLKMNSTYDGEFAIMVKPGGSFKAINGTLITANDISHNFRFVVNATGTLQFDRVTMHHCGMSGALPPEMLGLYVVSNNVKINNSNLSTNGYGIIVEGANITLTNSTLNHNEVHGAYFIDSSTSRIEHINVSENGFYGLAMIFSNLTAIKNVRSINNSFDGIAVYKSNLTMRNVFSDSNQRLGIITQSANVSIYDSTFTNNAFFDVYATGHSVSPFAMTGPGKVDLYDVIYGTHHLHDPTQSLNSSYSTNVSVRWMGGAQVPTANVTIFNNSGTADGGIAFKGKTDVNGRIKGIMVKVLEESPMMQATFSPHKFKAEKDGKAGEMMFNVSGPWTTAVVGIDSNIPVIKIKTPSEGALLNRSTFWMNGTASDFDGIDRVNVSWNGTNWPKATGNESWSIALTLGDGHHKLMARAFDKFGTANEATVNITIDTVPPVVEIKSPASGSLTNGSTVIVTGSTEVGAVVTVGGKTIPNVNGNFSFTASLVLEGPNTITVIAKDAANNTNETSVTVDRDTTSPIINVTWPPSGFMTKDDFVTISGQVMSATNMSFRNGPIFHEINVYTDFFDNNMPVFEGRNDMVIKAWDMAGNTATALVTVTKDTIPPVLQVQWPNITYTRERHITFKIMTEPGANVTVNGQPANDPNKDGNITYIFDLHQGQNSITVVSTDKMGNLNRTWKGVEADFLPPVLHIDRPAEGDVLKSREVNIIGSASDELVVTMVEAKVDDLEWFLCIGTDVWSNTLNLAPGPHTLTVRAWDLVGNNATAMVNFSVLAGPVDMLKPEVTISWPKDGTTLIEGTYIITGTALDDVNVKSVEWSTDGNSWYPCNGTAHWSLTVNLTKGSYIYYFRATDGSGKFNITSVSIIVKAKGTGGNGNAGSPYMLWLIIVLLIAIVLVALYAAYMGRRDTRAIEEEERIERRGAGTFEDEEVDDSEE
jgi:hypothetical protein